MSNVEVNFWNTINRMRSKGVEVEVERVEAAQFFGSSVKASTFCRGVYLSWTLSRKGGLNKRDSVRQLAMVDGVRKPLKDAIWKFWYRFEG